MGDLSGCVINWTNMQVAEWAKSENLSKTIEELIIGEDVDGKCILCLEERDIHTFREKYSYNLKFGEIKRFWIDVRLLQRDHQNLVHLFGLQDSGHTPQQLHDLVHLNDIETNNRISPPLSIDGRATTIQPELFKTFISLDERICVLLSSLGYAVSEPSEIAYPLIKEYVEAVVSSYIRSLRLQSGPQYKAWESKGFQVVKECVQKLSENLACEVVQPNTQKVTRSHAEHWLQQSPTLLRMLEHVFLHLYHHRPATANNPQDDKEMMSIRRRSVSDAKLLPFCECLQYVPDYPAFTDISQMLLINSNLPMGFRVKLRFLFSSQIHGASFSTFMGRIMDQGPSVIICEDTDGYIFGGFAPDSWSLSPNFVGNESAFLFTLRPKMRCFQSTGYNDHYQYLNLHQQTMPNGLGMGGQFNYWGLWLDSEYGKGECSESCTTFRDYVQLGVNKNFTIRNIEVWAVGEKPVKSTDGSPERSCLDGNLEEKAILELVGRQQYSDGYRDEPLE